MSRFLPRLDADDFVTVNRRAVLRGLGACALLVTTGDLFAGGEWANPVFTLYPFPLGVASGDPAPDGFVIWTKIAPKPLERGGGMPKKVVQVSWSVAADEGMQQVVRQGTELAFPELGHAVHVEVGGLEPARDYFYQFTVGGERSATGRSRTLPPPGAAVALVRFGLAGCQRYEDGFFTAYKEIARENFDFVFHYGDYIYEYAVGPNAQRPLPGEADECYSLDEYRQRYAIYKLDADLQAAHVSTPFVASYDDHEVENNWAGEISQQIHPPVPPALFLFRRAAAFQAWYEHMPVRPALMPRGPDILAYRRFAVGNLLAFNVLDTRLFRSDQPCGDKYKSFCPEMRDPKRTMLGDMQERWLYDGFRSAGTRWTVLGQQVIVMRNNRDPDPGMFGANPDQWDGAVAARDRLLAAIETAKLANLVVLTGDTHNNWAGELKKDFDDPASASLGVEFVGTSISSGGNGSATIDAEHQKLLAKDPHIKLFNDQRGYVRHLVTPERWQADFRVLDTITVRDGTCTLLKSFAVENGEMRLQ